MDFSGRKVLVTGAGQGIGRAIAKELCQRGAQVYALDKTEANLTSLKAENPQIQTIYADLSDVTGTRVAVEPHLPFHHLINNAGVALCEPFFEVTEQAYDTSMTINVKSILFLSQLVCKSMVDHKIKGSVVHVSSQASKIALENHTVYCSSKAAVDMLCKTMALELGPHGIRVNCVNPTVVFTEMGKKVWGDPAKATAQ